MNDTPFPAFGILLVDDEPAWLRSLSLTLESSAGVTNLFLCQDSRDVLPLLQKGGIRLALADEDALRVGRGGVVDVVERCPEVHVVRGGELACGPAQGRIAKHIRRPI